MRASPPVHGSRHSGRRGHFSRGDGASGFAPVRRRGYGELVTGAGRYGWLAALLVLALGASSAASHADGPPVAAAAANCADYPNQAAAQRAADTLDPDGDGIF